jgi:hypothetical protein
MTCVDQGPNLYAIRIGGHLSPTTLAAFPLMVSRLEGGETLLTGVLDRSGLYGVLAEVEALGLDLIEIRRLRTKDCP